MRLLQEAMRVPEQLDRFKCPVLGGTQTCNHCGARPVSRFFSTASIEHIVSKVLIALSPDCGKNLHGEIVIVTNSVESAKPQQFHFVAFSGGPSRHSVQREL